MILYRIQYETGNGGFSIVDSKGEKCSPTFETLDFCRAALLHHAADEMTRLAREAYKDGVQTNAQIKVSNDVVSQI